MEGAALIMSPSGFLPGSPVPAAMSSQQHQQQQCLPQQIQQQQVKQPCHHAALTRAGSEEERHAGSNSKVFLRHLRFFKSGQSAPPPASTAVLTIGLI